MGDHPGPMPESGSMLGILFTFWGMGFLISRKKGSFFLPRVMYKAIGEKHFPQLFSTFFLPRVMWTKECPSAGFATLGGCNGAYQG